MRKQTLIVNLPGSSKAVKEVSTRPNPISSSFFFVLCSSLFVLVLLFMAHAPAVQNIDVLLPVLPHAIGLLRQDPRAAQPSQHHKLDMK
jgi:molybdopterin biosynthesis enzyme MoaB